jgi:hypothetical protein
MLERGDMLRTWALARLPKAWQAAHLETRVADANCPPLALENEVEAVELADHRREYLDFEGELSGDRGSVSRVAEGSYILRDETADCLAIALEAALLEGFVDLSRENERSDSWTLMCLVERG